MFGDMSKPLKPGKSTVELVAGAARPSRIRRDPVRQTVVKPTELADISERDRLAMIVGLVTFGLAIMVLVIAIGSYAGWSPSQYTVEL